MEIRIKTQDEFLAGHVTIEIRADQDEVRKICNWCPEGTFSPVHHPDGGPEHRVTGYDPAKALEVMTENYQRARAEVDSLEIRLETVRQELSDREAELARMADNFNTSQSRAKVLEAEVRIQTERADQNQAWAERAEARLAEDATAAAAKLKVLQHRFDEAENRRIEVTTRIGRISGAVQGTAIKSALGRAWSGWNETEAVAVVNAVRDVRSILGIPLS
jgi:DNA repair exonuclease SbcCD ATPase subunit